VTAQPDQNNEPALYSAAFQADDFHKLHHQSPNFSKYVAGDVAVSWGSSYVPSARRLRIM
jgi:hypothetical protein